MACLLIQPYRIKRDQKMKYLKAGNVIVFRDYNCILKYQIKPIIQFIYQRDPQSKDPAIFVIKKAVLEYVLRHEKEDLEESRTQKFLISSEPIRQFSNEKNLMSELAEEYRQSKKEENSKEDSDDLENITKLKQSIFLCLAKIRSGKTNSLLSLQKNLDLLNSVIDKHGKYKCIDRERNQILEAVKRDSNSLNNALSDILRNIEFGEDE